MKRLVLELVFLAHGGSLYEVYPRVLVPNPVVPVLLVHLLVHTPTLAGRGVVHRHRHIQAEDNSTERSETLRVQEGVVGVVDENLCGARVWI